MDEIFRQVAQMFVDETLEQASRIGACLFELDGKPENKTDLIEQIFRDAHSLKGTSSSLGVQDIEMVVHTFEDALTDVRRHGAALSPTLMDAALAAMEAVKRRCAGLLADTREGSSELDVALRRLRELADKSAPSAELSAQPTLKSPESAAMAEHPVEVPIVAKADDGESGDTVVRVKLSQLNSMDRNLTDLRLLQGELDERVAQVRHVLASFDDALSHHRGAAAQGQQGELLAVRRALLALRRSMRDDSAVLQRGLLTLTDDVDSMRLVDVANQQATLAQAVREAARRLGKEAALEFRGGGVQVDRRLLEELKNPLLHLLRNAVAHGIEAPDERQRLSKAAVGRVELTFASEGSTVRISVTDDGRGIDPQQVKRRAIDTGLITAAEADALTSEAVTELLFRPGFTTETQANAISGRGVGLDVVRENVLRLHGQLTVDSQPRQGSTFTLRVPLSLATCDALLLRQQEQLFAIPLANVVSVSRCAFDELREVGGSLHLSDEDSLIPVADLAAVLGCAPRKRSQRKGLLTVVTDGLSRTALLCDELFSIEPITLRPLPTELEGIDLLSNIAVSSAGKPFFVLYPRALSHSQQTSRVALGAIKTPTVLVADDSITTRSLLRHMLEASGFMVITAADGEEALRLAQSHDLQLLVSDVRMPRLDGLTLTARLRQSERTRDLPIVLFSSLDAPDDVARGGQADAYISKADFERGALVDVIHDLVSEKT